MGFMHGGKGSSGYAPSPDDVRDFAGSGRLGYTDGPADLIAPAALPTSVDLRKHFCDTIWDQGHLNACTAFAATSLVEYFQRRCMGFGPRCSPGFVYRMTLAFLRRSGNVAADSRTTMKTLALLGVPPESQFTTDTEGEEFLKELEDPASSVHPFVYSVAQNYKAERYLRLDGSDLQAAYPHRKERGQKLLHIVKDSLARQVPAMFSVYLYAPSGLPKLAHQTTGEGRIPPPDERIARAIRAAIALRIVLAKAFGPSRCEAGTDCSAPPTELPDVLGHTIAACGYDDALVFTSPDGTDTRGGVRIRNSWSHEWGEGGYGWVPYEYITQGLTEDWWTLHSLSWVNARPFEPLAGDNPTG